jgi:hypothetical protein
MKKIEKLNIDECGHGWQMVRHYEKINELIDAVNEMQGESSDPFVEELEGMKSPEGMKIMSSMTDKRHLYYNYAITDIISRFKGRVKIIK